MRRPRYNTPLHGCWTAYILLGSGGGGGGISHLVVGLILLLHTTFLVRPTVGNLLVLLDEIAEAAAAGCSDVDNAVALEVVFLTNVGTLQRQRNPVKTNASSTANEHAL